MFVTVIHQIHDPEGFQTAEAKALEAGLPAGRGAADPCSHDRSHASASASGKANRSTAVREVVEGAVGPLADNEYFEMHVDGLAPSL